MRYAVHFCHSTGGGGGGGSSANATLAPGSITIASTDPCEHCGAKVWRCGCLGTDPQFQALKKRVEEVESDDDRQAASLIGLAQRVDELAHGAKVERLHGKTAAKALTRVAARVDTLATRLDVIEDARVSEPRAPQAILPGDRVRHHATGHRGWVYEVEGGSAKISWERWVKFRNPLSVVPADCSVPVALLELAPKSRWGSAIRCALLGYVVGMAVMGLLAWLWGAA